MFYYGQMDLALGRFLENYVFCDQYRCPNFKYCQSSMDHHMRTFCNGNNTVTIDISKKEEKVFPAEENVIIMWKYCLTCKLVTNLAPLPYDAYMYSFAMFLTMIMYERLLVRRGSSAEVCKHSLHRDHLTCFSMGRTVASFKYEPIVCPQLRLPPKAIRIPAPFVDADSLSEDNRMLSTHGKMIYSAIFDEIKRIMTCGIKLLEETTAAYLEEHTKSHNEFRELMNTLTAFQGRSDYLQEGRSLVFRIRKHLCRSLLNWKALVAAMLERGKKEAQQSEKSRKESGTGGGTPVSPDQLAEAGSVDTTSSSSAKTKKVEDVLTALPKNHDYIYQAPFSDAHHYCLSPSQTFLVDEKQISSIIAYALNSPNHARFLSTPLDESQEQNPKVAMQKRHFPFTFSDETCKFFCCSYFAREFQSLRDAIVVKDGAAGAASSPVSDFVTSLSECHKWDNTGGKSGSTFFKTKDDRFILKEMNSYESSSSTIEPFMMAYFDYMRAVVEDPARPSCIAKILGFYKVASTNTGGHSFKMDLLVIENIFYGRDIKHTFDLKGSIRNRMVDTSTIADSNLVLWDENLLKKMCKNPLYLSSRENTKMLEAIDNDTKLLRGNHMMDYSMLLGISRDQKELVVGIVDYIRAFTWDKKVEQLLKQSGLLGRGDRRMPTCVDPGLYMERFKEAMYKYFIPVPDFCHRGGPAPVPGQAEEPTQRQNNGRRE